MLGKIGDAPWIDTVLSFISLAGDLIYFAFVDHQVKEVAQRQNVIGEGQKV